MQFNTIIYKSTIMQITNYHYETSFQPFEEQSGAGDQSEPNYKVTVNANKILIFIFKYCN